MSRFNKLYLGDAKSVIEELEADDGSVDELRVALINALGMIDRLQTQVIALQTMAKQPPIARRR